MQTSSSQRVRLARAHDDRPDQAQRFYSDVVGISVLLMGEGPGAYRLAMVDDTPVGGFVGLATADRPGPPEAQSRIGSRASGLEVVAPTRTGSPTKSGALSWPILSDLASDRLK